MKDVYAYIIMRLPEELCKGESIKYTYIHILTKAMGAVCQRPGSLLL